MKKLMTALAVCLAAGFVSATGGSVMSSNVVGYTTLSFSGLEVFGANFHYLNNGVVSSFAGAELTGTANIADDALLVFDPTLGDFYTFLYTSGGIWKRQDPNTGDLVETNAPTFAPGGAVLFSRSDTSASMIQAGQVPSGPQVTIFNDTDLKVFASKLPVNVTITDLKTFVQTDDTVLVYDESLLDFYSYLFTGSGEVKRQDPNDGSLVTVSDSTILLPIGHGAIFVPGGVSGDRTWTQSL